MPINPTGTLMKGLFGPTEDERKAQAKLNSAEVRVKQSERELSHAKNKQEDAKDVTKRCGQAGQAAGTAVSLGTGVPFLGTAGKGVGKAVGKVREHMIDRTVKKAESENKCARSVRMWRQENLEKVQAEDGIINRIRGLSSK